MSETTRLWAAHLREDDFRVDRVEYQAILRELTIVGEAIKSLPGEFTASRPEIPWRGFAGLRDVIVHRYFGIMDHAVWEVVETEVPPLLQEIGLALNDLEGEP